MDFDALLLDLDDTLMDHLGTMQAGVDAWCAELGLPTGQADRFRAIEKKWFSAYERGEVTHAQQRAERCREFVGRPELSDTAALELYDGYLAAYRAHWRAFPDAAPLLEKMHAAGIAIGVFTNGTAEMQRGKLRAGDLDRNYVHLFATVDIGKPKPDPESYLHACAALGVAPERTLMVGDSLVNDVEGARAAELQALHLDRAGGGDIRDLSEL